MRHWIGRRLRGLANRVDPIVVVFNVHLDGAAVARRLHGGDDHPEA